MKFMDLTNERKIPVYTELAKKLSASADSESVLKVFMEAMQEVHRERSRLVICTQDLEPGQYRVSPLLNIADEEHSPARSSAVASALESIFGEWYLGSIESDLPVYEGGFLGDIIETLEPKLVYEMDVQDDPVVGDLLSEFGSVLATPMYFTGSPEYWVVLLDKEPRGLDHSELSETILRGNLIGTVVSNLVTSEELQSANKRIEQEVDNIAQLQKQFLPRSKQPPVPNLVVDTSYETFDRAGGDYYDFIPLLRIPETGKMDVTGPWAIFIADAAGHGPAAAVVTAMVHTVLNGIAGVPRGPSEILEYMNDRLRGRRMTRSLVTAFCGVYDPKAQTITYARAGHDPPLLATPAGDTFDVRPLDDVGGFPLGVMPLVDSEEATIALEPGQTLVLYTDGITDAQAPAGNRFGVKGIEQALKACSGDPDCIVMTIIDTLKTFEGGRRPQDDQTLVVTQVN
jgi:sigma-B regulation protein RsbU (phosphoserine phosphatase)